LNKRSEEEPPIAVALFELIDLISVTFTLKFSKDYRLIAKELMYSNFFLKSVTFCVSVSLFMVKGFLLYPSRDIRDQIQLA